ncbi:hypothetical protein nbrc107697_13660 [Gordonia crocea]|uniref:Uncharacterized protein n=1 Tax=Gordonia crocea TaxID=589162 RepID=A0A7I9UVT9_9ACTN|nr:hypothetical protein nbrc107697_13660 [Gordonia crocea]
MSPEPCTTVRCEAEAWAERAKVAKWAAEELDACGQIIGRILASNYFGTGCAEAPPVYLELAAAVSTGSSSWREALAVQASSMASLSAGCGSAATEFGREDAVGAQSIES